MDNSVVLDPPRDLVEAKAQMSTESVGGNWVGVTSAGPAVDERFRDVHQLGHLLDRQVAARREQLQLLRSGFLGPLPAAHVDLSGETTMRIPRYGHSSGADSI